MLKVLIAIAVLMMTGAARGPDLPLSFKGSCTGNQTDVKDLSAIQNTPAIKCDSATVFQINGRTAVALTIGAPDNIVLMFAGDLSDNRITQPFDPYFGPILSFFPISAVNWGDGTQMPIHANEHMDPNETAGRSCAFHFTGQGWGQLSEIECELIVDTPNHRPRHATATFKTVRAFNFDGQQVQVEFGTHGANSFRTEFNQTQINGTCGMNIYQTTDGALRHAEPGSAIERLFQTVCYKSK
jgi:hypothetical protein